VTRRVGGLLRNRFEVALALEIGFLAQAGIAGFDGIAMSQDRDSSIPWRDGLEVWWDDGRESETWRIGYCGCTNNLVRWRGTIDWIASLKGGMAEKQGEKTGRMGWLMIFYTALRLDSP
jgi:hypothetical protein